MIIPTIIPIISPVLRFGLATTVGVGEGLVSVGELLARLVVVTIVGVAFSVVGVVLA